jgi:DNA-binding transcriptional MerR regulator
LSPRVPKETTGLYTDIHVERLQFIRHCRVLDMTLEEIRNLLKFRDAPDENCTKVNALLDEHIEHVNNRIKELRFLQKNLRALRSQCEQARAIKDCRILQSLGNPATSPLRSSDVEHRNSRLHKTHNDPHAIPLLHRHAMEGRRSRMAKAIASHGRRCAFTSFVGNSCKKTAFRHENNRTEPGSVRLLGQVPCVR